MALPLFELRQEIVFPPLDSAARYKRPGFQGCTTHTVWNLIPLLEGFKQDLYII